MTISYVLALSRSGDDDFLCAGIEMTLGLCSFGEEPGRFDDDVDTEFLPGKGGRTLCDGKAFNLVPFTTRVSSSAASGRRLFTVDLALEPALGRVVFEEICEIVRRNEVVYCSDLVARFEESLLNHRAKEKPSDASEAIDADCSHLSIVVGFVGYSS